jgi:hypothetical protein
MRIKLTHTSTRIHQFIILLSFLCIPSIHTSAQFSGGNSDGFATGTIGSSGTEVLLPVTLILFDVVDTEERIKLIWETASETNNDYFTIEKSVNGNDWTPIQVIKGQGNSTCKQLYETYDEHPVDGLSYYHLKQTDFDGKSTVSQMESVYRGTMDEFSVFPNPTHNVLVLTVKESMERTPVNVYNTMGQLVWSTVLNTTLSKQELLDMSALQAGWYFIQLSSPTGKKNSQSCQFLKVD